MQQLRQNARYELKNSCSSILNSSGWRHALADDAVEITHIFHIIGTFQMFQNFVNNIFIGSIVLDILKCLMFLLFKLDLKAYQ